ncbi:MAG: glycosyl hydrolase 53 family protein [Blautia sp.]|nr:glycosyl hydrolase 53 family protein [Blautia sp.]
MKKRWAKRITSVVLALAMILAGLGPWSDGLMVVKAAENAFTLYYYSESSDALYVNVWNWAGISLPDSNTLSSDWGWKYSQAVMQPVEGNAKWYSVDFSILDASTADGFTIYQGGSADSNKVVEYDDQWNNSTVYATLIGGTNDAYAIKNGTVYTDLAAAGLSFSESGVTYSKEDLKALMDSIPADYASLGFTDTEALAAAMSSAQTCYSNASATAEDIKTCYEALASVISNLIISDGDIFIKKIDGYDAEASIRGMDVSSYVSIMNSFDELNKSITNESDKLGFRDFDGNLLDRQGFFTFLASQGVNYIRLRVWNDPYDASGNGYGGGTNDVAAAKEMGKYATIAGMDVLIDFHYSDFWADPGKQKAPKAWASMQLADKVSAVSEFTENALTELIDAGVNVTMVQVGNETNGAICGEKDDWAKMDQIFDAGCDAVHKVAAAKGRTILAAVHFTNPEASGRQAGYAKNLADYDGDGDGTKEGVSYDVFATSWYPYWHGTLQNLQSVLGTIAGTYDKYVMVAETSWAFTLDDGDGHDNTVRLGNNDSDPAWSFSVQGQADEFRDVLATISNIDVTLTNGDKAGLGAFWWEGAWIPVQYAYNEDGTANEEIINANKVLWEKYGSGWAASYGGGYDAEDAGKWYGGSAVDNQAFFDFHGNAMACIKVYNANYLTYGAKGEVKAVGYTPLTYSMEVGDTAVLPVAATVLYNDGTSVEKAVTWNAEEVEALNAKAATTAGIGEHVIYGALSDDREYEIVCKVTIDPGSQNLLKDSSFEGTIADNWAVEGDLRIPPKGTDTAKDAHSGSYSCRWYHAKAGTAGISQSVTVTEPGAYSGYVFAQGLAGDKVKVSISLDDTVKEAEETLDGWAVWKKPMAEGLIVTQDMIDAGNNTIIFKITVTSQDGGWGGFDDAALYWAGSVPSGMKVYEGDTEVTSVSLEEGASTRLTAEYDAGVSVTIWSVEDETCVSVDSDGKITALKAGETTVTATNKFNSAVSATITVTVTEKPAPPEDPDDPENPDDPKDPENPDDPNKPTEGEEDDKKPESSSSSSSTATGTTILLLPDGTRVETTADGTTTATKKTENDDGSVTETKVVTNANGTVVSAVETVTNADGSVVEKVSESELNTRGKEVDVTTTTKTDAEGKVTSVTEKSVIAQSSATTSTTVTVKKDGEGEITSAKASISKTLEKGNKTTIPSSIVGQITEAAGTPNVIITMTVKDKAGNTKYKVQVESEDLKAGNELYIYKLDTKKNEYVMVNAKTYEVNSKGDVSVSMSKKATYTLVDKETAAKIDKEIKATITPKKSSTTVKKGKNTTFKLSDKANKDNIKSITYTTSDKSVATVDKNGKIVAKKNGTVTVKAKVTLKNGTTKTIKIKVKVK